MNKHAANGAAERDKLARQVQRLRAQVKALKARLAAAEEGGLPELPPANASGNYPALETVRIILARKIIAARREAGLSRPELATRAGIRLESLLRIERGEGSPNPGAVPKIEAALKAATKRTKGKTG